MNGFAFHCWHVDKRHGAAIPCEGSAVRHGFCDAHLREGHEEAARRGWALNESSQEAAE